ncbi:acyl-CoA carboxylase subunit epsilon [Marmoricola sp. RAF53]|uniref:acyl-CoA carboxylase subunit epsilon n=1 Tax=Marmoricola sp. RAF53 TaxID=3233059 RepID=UPI003F978327
MTGTESQAPVLRVVNPDATPEEIAAIVAVFSALGGAAPAARKPVPAWAANAARMRPAHPHGRGGWRSSGLPR